jgi:chromosome segregation ATPase
MGNIFSNNQLQSTVQQLQERLENIEKIDLNNDGVISKSEFEKWKLDGLQDIKNAIKMDIRNEYEDKMINLNKNIDNLQKEIEALRSINRELEDNLHNKNTIIQKLGANIESNDDVKELVSMLSKEQINIYVEEMLANEETNIKYLPDVVERQIYRNMFKLTLKMLNKIMNSVSFEMINHKMSINMIPNIDVNNLDI